MTLAPTWVAPRSVTVRWLLSAVFWVVAVLALLVLFAPDDEARLQLREEGPFASAVVTAADGDEVSLTYRHVVVGDVTASTDAEGAVGDRVEIAYDVDDPYWIVRRDDRSSDDLTVWMLVLAVVVLVGTWSLAQWSARQSRRVIESSTTFTMLAALHWNSWSVVPRLSLYAVDSATGDRPVCTIRLADIRATAPHAGCFDVEVKGVPRPGGRVVVRHDGGVWWPRGKALITARHPRPTGDLTQSIRRGWGAPLPPPPTSGWGPPSAPPPPVRRHQGPLLPSQPGPSWPPVPASAVHDGARRSWRRLWWSAAVGVVGVVVTLVAAGITLHNSRATEQWLSDGSPAIATITGHDEFAVVVDLNGVDTNGPATTMTAPVDYPEDFELDRRYPAIVSADAEHVRLLAEPYDAVEPIMWWALPTLIVLWWVIWRALGG